MFNKTKDGADPVVAALSELTAQVKLLREDVQRSGVISGLLSRPGGMSMKDVIAAADRFAAEVKD